MSELPVGWVECSLEDLLGSLSDGKVLHQGWSPQCESTPAPEGEWGVLKTTAVQDGYFLEKENKELPPALSPKPELEVRAGDLLMTCAGPRSRCGVICHVSKTRAKLIFSGKIYRFRPNAEHVEPKFLTHLLRTAELKEKIDDIKTGISESGMNMTRDRFFSLPVRLAPHTEQTRIAQKLDALLAQVDTLKVRIDAIPALLKRFRQSVLAAAVSGRLTEEWRLAQARSEKAASIVKLSEIALKITDGEHITPPMTDSGVPLLSAKDVQTNHLGFDQCRYLSREVADKARRRCDPARNDILVVSRGATVGRTHRVRTDHEFCLMGSVLLIRPDLELIHPEYLEISFTSLDGQKQLIETSGSSAQQAIYIRDVKKFSLVLPPLEEQTEIIRRVEQLFAFADQLESKVQSAKSRIDHLTQSILAKAFRGELVPQDPNDEPASVLLDRIQAQRAAAPKAKRGRRVSTQ